MTTWVPGSHFTVGIPGSHCLFSDCQACLDVSQTAGNPSRKKKHHYRKYNLVGGLEQSSQLNFIFFRGVETTNQIIWNIMFLSHPEPIYLKFPFNASFASKASPLRWAKTVWGEWTRLVLRWKWNGLRNKIPCGWRRGGSFFAEQGGPSMSQRTNLDLSHKVVPHS